MYHASAHMLEDWFYNLFTGYYMYLVDVMLLVQEYGDQWVEHSMACITLSNIFSNVGHGAARAIYWPKDSPWSPRHTREFAQETHFGNAKSAANFGQGLRLVFAFSSHSCHTTPAHFTIFHFIAFRSRPTLA